MIGPNKKRNVWLICFLLGFVTLILYWPARHYDFVQYDDNHYVFDNPTVRDGLSGSGLVWSFVDAHESNWHPLTWLSHMLDCQLFGLNAGPHHLVNVLLHCANVVLLFFVLQKMTGAFWRSAFVAAVFALHPLRVESVAWISERKDVLSGLFFMLTLWAYIAHVRQRARTAAPRSSPFAWLFSSQGSFYKLSLVFFTLGLLSKPMLVTLPFVLLLIDLWPLNRFDFFEKREDTLLGFPKKLWIEKIPFLLLAFAAGLITFFAQKSSGAVKSLAFHARIENVLTGYIGYLEKIFWPKDLTVLYLRHSEMSALTIILSALVLLAIFVVAGINLRQRPYLATGWLWFIGMLLPVSGLISIGDLFMADRYTYLPSIGFYMLVAWGGWELVSGICSARAGRVIAIVCAACLLVACAILSHRQLMYWKNTETLMNHALEINPNNFVAHINLGVHFSKLGKTEDALAHYQRARELEPARTPNRSRGPDNNTRTNLSEVANPH